MNFEINDDGEVTREINKERRWVGKLGAETRDGVDLIYFENCSFRLYTDEMAAILKWVNEKENGG